MTTPKDRLHRFDQASAYDSPWSIGTRIRLAAWSVVWLLLFRPTPKFFSAWRVFLMRLFGARVRGRVFISESARIRMPWNLVMDDRAAIGPRAYLYNLALVRLGTRCTVAQDVYLCGGTHDFESSRLPLVVGPIEIGADAFVGARAFIMPGVCIGEGAVVGAASVVTRDLPEWTYCAGNPCRAIKPRKMDKGES